jgi:diguanylate cyclase (GGDEF)-like protein
MRWIARLSLTQKLMLPLLAIGGMVIAAGGAAWITIGVVLMLAAVVLVGKRAQGALEEHVAMAARLLEADAVLKQQAKIGTLLGQLAEVANEARALPDALGECLKLVCEFTGWAIGHAALVRRDGDCAVTYLNVWHSGAPERYATFMNDNEQYRFPLKVGAFATRVLTTRRPVWDRDLAARSGFGRLGFLKQAGLVSGIALPVPVPGELPGLIEFFTEQPADADAGLLAALERASMHIGRVVERQKTEQGIQRLNAELEQSNLVLEQRNQESAQITEMSNLLQTATDMQEASEILSRLIGRLLAPHAGAIYLTAASLNRLERLTAWGDAKSAAVIGIDDCWGVRRARTYCAADPQHDVFCTHVHSAGNSQPYMCVPMMAQSTSLGMFHVQFVADAGGSEAGKGSDVAAAERLRVQRLADQVAMALANLKLRQSLREQSIRDALTGLYNRRFLEESLERELSRTMRDAQPLAVLMIDVDHFKRYNDQYGHDGGDAVLRALGRTLREMLRTGDLAARYGGEEFTVALHNAPVAGAHEWSERLREAMRQLEVKSGAQVLPPVTISLGLALFPDHGKTSGELLHAADLALYEAKHSGRDRLVVAGRGAKGGATAHEVVVAMPRTA